MELEKKATKMRGRAFLNHWKKNFSVFKRIINDVHQLHRAHSSSIMVEIKREDSLVKIYPSSDEKKSIDEYLRWTFSISVTKSEFILWDSSIVHDQCRNAWASLIVSIDFLANAKTSPSLENATKRISKEKVESFIVDLIVSA